MFVRTMLALSLSCIFAGTAIAASTAEQPLTPTKVTNVAIQDPIDPLATEASAATSQTSVATSQISAQEQEDLNQASQTLDTLQKTEDVKADIGAAPTAPTTTTTTAPTGKVTWRLSDLTVFNGMTTLVKVSSRFMHVRT